MVHSPLYERNQSTHTTETVARIYLLFLRHPLQAPFFYTQVFQAGVRFFVRSWIIRTFLPTRVRAVFTWPYSSNRYAPPPKGNLELLLYIIALHVYPIRYQVPGSCVTYLI